MLSTPLSKLSALLLLLLLLTLSMLSTPLSMLPLSPPWLSRQPPPTTPPLPLPTRMRCPSPTPTPTVSLMITQTQTSTRSRQRMLTVLSEDPTLLISLTAEPRLSPTLLMKSMVLLLMFLTLVRLCILLLLLVDMLVREPMSTKLLSLHTTPRKCLHCVLSLLANSLVEWTSVFETFIYSFFLVGKFSL